METTWKEPPEDLDGHVVAMAGALGMEAVFLTRDGKVRTWRCPQPPDDEGPFRQVRAGANVYAAQRTNGTWFCWGDEDGVARAEQFNQQLQRLGPLKDFALGKTFFIAIK